ncbi:MAG: phosphopyruvate hydratase [Candidatus Levybacteria bacterium]|nr:phosphopyruvate hydratase [Candidatus Levybacteria bacterium]
MKIVSVKAYEILDSRGNPTIESTVTLADGSEGKASVPSGASTGKHEATELRDENPKRYNGLGVLKAVKNINIKIAPKLIKLKAENQEKIDNLMIALDGTQNKSKLGANAILAVSLANAKAAANSQKKPLYEYLTKFNPDFKKKFIMPIPQMNLLNGGKHGNWSTDIQEYMIMPIGAKSIQEAVRICTEVYYHLKDILKTNNYSIGLGDEGGFSPSFNSNEEPFLLLSKAIKKAGYKLRKDFVLAIDSASSEFFNKGKYKLNKERKTMSSKELGTFYEDLLRKYPIASIEDPFSEDDWEGFKDFTNKLGKKIQIVGDDLYATNVSRLKRGIREKTTNAILIKLNQIGTLTETVNAILLAKKNNMTSIISHRSGETEDTFIADFAVAMGVGQIKTGAPSRGERVAKYNRLMAIERELRGNAKYAKFHFKTKFT